MHKALVCARLKDGDEVVASLLPMMTDSGYYTSLMTDHDTNRRCNCYCTDTLFGTMGAINDALLFSNTGIIEVLPALPSEWKSGSIHGLMARTQVEVRELTWNLLTNTVIVTLNSIVDHNEIKLRLGIPWTKAMVQGKENQVLDDASGNYIHLTLNSSKDAN